MTTCTARIATIPRTRTKAMATTIITTTTSRASSTASDRAFDPARLEDFLGAIVNIYGPRMLRYKGVLHMQGTDRKVIFQGVHQLMGSDLGPAWAADEKRNSRMVFIGIDLPREILEQGLDQCLVVIRPAPAPELLYTIARLLRRPALFFFRDEV